MQKGNSTNYITKNNGKKTEQSRDKIIDKHRKISPNKQNMEINHYIKNEIDNRHTYSQVGSLHP